MKTTGAEFKRFYNDNTVWLEGYWHEGEIVKVGGIEIDTDAADYNEIPDDVAVMVKGGVVLDAACNDVDSFENHFKKWLRAQSIETLIVTVDKSKAEAVRAAILAAGGKVA